MKSENLINSEYHALTTMKAPGIQASLTLSSADLRSAAVPLPADLGDVTMGLEVARVQSSLLVTMRNKYSDWEVDARKQYQFLKENDVTKRLGELAEYQQVNASCVIPRLMRWDWRRN